MLPPCTYNTNFGLDLDDGMGRRWVLLPGGFLMTSWKSGGKTSIFSDAKLRVCSKLGIPGGNS